MEYDIEFIDVSFTYEGAKTPAIENINLKVQPGEVVLITGPSGAGKTTLCSCLNGLVPHFHNGVLKGQVLVKDRDIVRIPAGSHPTGAGPGVRLAYFWAYTSEFDLPEKFGEGGWE